MIIPNSNIQKAISMLDGHHRFLERNTGTTHDPKVDFFVINEEGVIANNRHYISETAMEYHPNGNSTSEAQSLGILGYIYAYIGTGQPHYLKTAIWYFDAYLAYFYEGRPIPETPQRWIANWILNGKQPYLSNYPLDLVSPTHSGFKSIELEFTDGLTQVPHDAPLWGQYIDKATFAFDGRLGYDSINASVVAYKENGTSVDWGTDGVKYPVDWIITWAGTKVNSSGAILSSGHVLAERGTVQLQDTTVQGVHKFNFATKNPVEHGGYEIQRNQVHHNRPVHVPVLGPANLQGNAADGEVWFLDCCHLLWKITGETRYKKARDAVLFTAHEYLSIDSLDKFFRQSEDAGTPFSDGISYDYTYPSTMVIEYDRDASGYIGAYCYDPGTPNTGGKLTMEQKSIRFRINSESICRTTFGGIDEDDGPISAQVYLEISSVKEGDGIGYIADLLASNSASVVSHDIPLNRFTRAKDEAGNAYLMAAENATTHYGAASRAELFELGVNGDRDAKILQATFDDGTGALIIGFWLLAADEAPINSIVYRADIDTRLRITDSEGWRWTWLMPSTLGAWGSMTFLPEDAEISSYQPNHTEALPEEFPALPVYTAVEDLTVYPDTDTSGVFAYYCVNDIPPLFSDDDGWTALYNVTFSAAAPYYVRMGDCTMLTYRDDALNYCPGVVPFSNIYQRDSEQIGAWHGLPYPGYQSPAMFAFDFSENDDVKMENCVNFLWDSQQWYYNEFGVMGPGASAYIWDRWDAVEYGPANTWTMYHWGDAKAWSGYQPRAYCWAARCWQELVTQEKTVPPKLIEYVDNWSSYLIDFWESTGTLPDDFPSDSVPVARDGRITGHITGLWLAGACFAAIAGSTVPGMSKLIEACNKEFQDYYIVIPTPDHPMNGSWSPWESPSTNGGMYFGFWFGEIMRGLGLYLFWKSGRRAADIFQTSYPIIGLGDDEDPQEESPYVTFYHTVPLLNPSAETGTLFGWQNNAEGDAGSGNVMRSVQGNGDNLPYAKSGESDYYFTGYSGNSNGEWIRQTYDIPSTYHATIDDTVVFCTLEWLQSSYANSDGGRVQVAFINAAGKSLGIGIADDCPGFARNADQPWRLNRGGFIIPAGTRSFEVLALSTAWSGDVDTHFDEITLSYGNNPTAFNWGVKEEFYAPMVMTVGSNQLSEKGFRNGGAGWGSLAPSVLDGVQINGIEAHGAGSAIPDSVGVSFSSADVDWDHLYIQASPNATSYVVLNRAACELGTNKDFFTFAGNHYSVDNLANTVPVAHANLSNTMAALATDDAEIEILFSKRVIPTSETKLGDVFWGDVISLQDFLPASDANNFPDRQGEVWTILDLASHWSKKTPFTTTISPQMGTRSDRYLRLQYGSGLAAPATLDAELNFTGDFTLEWGMSRHLCAGLEGKTILHAGSGAVVLTPTNLTVHGESFALPAGKEPTVYPGVSHRYFTLQRSGSTVSLWVNGELLGELVYAGTINLTGLKFATNGSDFHTVVFTALMSDIRITKGVARHAVGASFTPSRQSFPATNDDITRVLWVENT